jgi:hypothetical protein
LHPRLDAGHLPWLEPADPLLRLRSPARATRVGAGRSECRHTATRRAAAACGTDRWAYGPAWPVGVWPNSDARQHPLRGALPNLPPTTNIGLLRRAF